MRGNIKVWFLIVLHGYTWWRQYPFQSVKLRSLSIEFPFDCIDFWIPTRKPISYRYQKALLGRDPLVEWTDRRTYELFHEIWTDFEDGQLNKIISTKSDLVTYSHTDCVGKAIFLRHTNPENIIEWTVRYRFRSTPFLPSGKGYALPRRNVHLRPCNHHLGFRYVVFDIDLHRISLSWQPSYFHVFETTYTIQEGASLVIQEIV
jgi:hypothetical protein